MSVVDQALLKIFANERRRSAAGVTQPANAVGTTTSTPDAKIAAHAETLVGNEPLARDTDDRFLAAQFDIPATTTSLGGPMTDPPKPRQPFAAASETDQGHDTDVHEAGLQVAGLTATSESRNLSANDSSPEVVDQQDTTPDFAAATFRIDAAHERRVPTAHLLSLAGHETNNEQLAEAEDAGPTLPSDMSAVLETEEIAASQEPGGPTEDVSSDFKPAFEVDQFRWPTICESLYAVARSDIRAAATRVLSEARSGQNVIALAGLECATGCTTFTLCLAQRLAALNASVLVVDANLGNPSLAHSLGIASTFGWNQDLHERHDVTETLIESVQDRIAVAPLHVTESANLPQEVQQLWRRLIAVVRPHFDVVLVDAEPLERSLSASHFSVFEDGTVDQVILLQLDSPQATSQLAEPVRGLLAAGVTPLGIVRNAHAYRTSAEH